MISLDEVTSLHYLPDGSFEAVEAELSELEINAMSMALSYADEALAAGDPPVGAVLLDRRNGLEWGACTSDKSARDIMGHAEVRAYNLAQPTVGDELQECTLVTTSQPCTSCTPPFVEGKIGKIIYAASRADVWPITGIMRPRTINMHELLVDGATDTTVIGGYRRDEAIGKFTLWAELQKTKGAPEVSEAAATA